MISFEEARAILTRHSSVLGNETVDLDQADGRVLAADVAADRDYPPFHRSTMDGYAIREEDWLVGIRTYTLAEIIFAGQPCRISLAPGFCYKIMTGAAVPPPANAVVRVEDSIVNGDLVTLNASEVRPFMNIARQGEDVLSGEVILKQFSRLRPHLISMLSVVGCTEVLVKKLPSVAIVTTGDEVVPVGREAPQPYQIRNSNSRLIRSMLKEYGIFPRFETHVPDDRNQIRDALATAIESDLVIVNGGVSAGDADYVPQILAELNVKKLFHKVAIRPGKPIWLGLKPNGGMVFALPGNPFSCMVTFKLFVKCYLDLVQGLQPARFMQMPFEGTRAKRVNLNEFFPVRLNEEGTALSAVPINNSGDIRLGLGAGAIALHQIDTGVIHPGDFIKFFFL